MSLHHDRAKGVEMDREPICLRAWDIARVTGGEWINLDHNIVFYGVNANISRLKEGDLCFTTRPDQWGSKVPFTEERLETIFAKGALAAVVTNESHAKGLNHPVLLVPNAYEALKKMAFYVRDRSQARRVLVTGTEGKTGFKHMLYHLLSEQTEVHARLDSANLNVPILSSLASIGCHDKVEIVEASVANRGVGKIRSRLVQPDICVITEVGYEHLSTHGSLENLIVDKAEIIDGLHEKGLCVLNADSAVYDRLREAIYVQKYVDIITFGSTPYADARLLDAVFDEKALSWDVKSEIDGEPVEYTLPVLGEHAPLSSLAPLLVAKRLGYDVQNAAKAFGHFRSSETMGRLTRIVSSDKRFLFYDHSHRASILSYASALRDLSRLSPMEGGKKIAVIGNMLNIGALSPQAHKDLAPMIEAAGVERLYTVGFFAKPLHDALKDPSILAGHGESYKEIETVLLNDIGDGDLLFIKGHHRIWLKQLAAKIYSLGACYEVR